MPQEDTAPQAERTAANAPPPPAPAKSLRQWLSGRETPPTLNLEARWAESADMAAFLADAAALNRRLSSRRSWVRSEVALRLQGAVNAARAAGTGNAAQNMQVARETLAKAQAVYLDDMQAKNRVIYLSGLVLGVALMVLLPLVLLWFLGLAARGLEGTQDKVQETVLGTLEWFSKAAPLTTTAPLFFFAGLGACASVLSRLTTIDLKGETSRAMVLLAAAIRPALAVIFACVMFVILKNKIVSVGTEEVSSALIWISAFLCGYSERFATDMLERVPLGAGAAGAAPAAPAAAPPAAGATAASAAAAAIAAAAATSASTPGVDGSDAPQAPTPAPAPDATVDPRGS